MLLAPLVNGVAAFILNLSSLIYSSENIGDTPLRGAAVLDNGQSMTATILQDIEHSDPLDSQPICSKGLP